MKEQTPWKARFVVISGSNRVVDALEDELNEILPEVSPSAINGAL